MTLPVGTTPEADAQIREVESWWRRHRPASPEIFLDELTASFEIIGQAPEIGRLYRQSPIPGTRRVLLKGTRYQVSSLFDRLKVGLFLFVILGLFAVHGVTTPGTGRFMYVFLIPFWALFPALVLDLAPTLVLLAAYVIGFSDRENCLPPHQVVQEKETRSEDQGQRLNGQPHDWQIG